MFARTDEVDLLTVLHGGLHEDPRFATFLARMQRRMRADHVSLIFGQGSSPIHTATQWFAGRDLRAQAQQLAELAALDPIPYQRLRPGRVYSAAEMIDPEDARHSRFRREYLDRIGIHYGRFMRVTEPGGSNVWLVASRAMEDFTAADSALLSALAPHLSIALQTLGALERARYRETIATDALGRAGIAWFALDRTGRMIDRESADGEAARTSARTIADDPEAERILIDLAQRMGEARATHPRAIRLDGGGRRELLAVPLPDRPLAASVMPAMAVLLRTPRQGTAQTAQTLLSLFGLSPSEARLATCLANGQSLAEAASTLHLSLQTARTYSKRLFEKTGTRGQADLVRVVLTSVAVLA